MAAFQRRDVLRGTAWILAGHSIARAGLIKGALPWRESAGTPPFEHLDAHRPGQWSFFTPSEAATLEAIADRLVPPDPQTPGGKDAGCVSFIDRQLVGSYGHDEGLYAGAPFVKGAKQQGPQSALLPRELYRKGIAAHLQGYEIQGWFAPDITGSGGGLDSWSASDIVEYLQRGHNRFAGASSPMAEVVEHTGARIRTDDLHAIATYLKHVSGMTQKGQALAAGDPRMAAGAAIYTDLCSACHKRNGSGVPYLIPDLAASAAVAARAPTTVLRVVLGGAQSVATSSEPTAPAMPSYGWQLNDTEAAAVATYVRNSWGHSSAAVSESDVQGVRSRLRGHE